MEHDMDGRVCHWGECPFTVWVEHVPEFDPTDYGDNNSDNNNDNNNDNKDDNKDDAGDPEEPPKKVAKTAETE